MWLLARIVLAFFRQDLLTAQVWGVSLTIECIDSAYLCRQVEDKDAEEWDEHGGQDQVDRVEQGLSPDGDVERDVRLGRCRVVEDVQVGWHLDDVPRARLPVVRQVHVIFVVVQG